MNLFITQLFDNPRYFFAQLLIVVFSVSLHEYMHARIALAEGDDTAATQGHLTLNPFRQMGMWSLVMLLFLGICWGSVPIDPRKMRRKISSLLVALAGPATNLLLGVAFAAVFLVLYGAGVPIKGNEFGYSMLSIGSMLNFVLFLLNILPIPGLDGFQMIVRFLPYEKVAGSEFLKGATVVVLVLAITFARYLFLAAEFLTLLLVRYGTALLNQIGLPAA